MIDINASREFSLLRLKFVINKLSAWRNQIAFEHGEFWNSLKICLFWLWLLHARTHTYTFVEGRYSRMYKKDKNKKRREVGDESKEPSHYVACLPIPSFPAFLHDSLRALPYLALLLSKSTHACMHAWSSSNTESLSHPQTEQESIGYHPTILVFFSFLLLLLESNERERAINVHWHMCLIPTCITYRTWKLTLRFFMHLSRAVFFFLFFFPHSSLSFCLFLAAGCSHSRYGGSTRSTTIKRTDLLLYHSHYTAILIGSLSLNGFPIPNTILR